MAKLTIETLRSTLFDKANLWEIIVFDENFPDGKLSSTVNDVEINWGQIEYETLDGTPYQFPSGRSAPTLTISWYQDVDLSFIDYYLKWFEEIAPYIQTNIAPITEITKTITVNKLDYDRESKIATFSFLVVPSSDIIYHGESDGNIPVQTLSFNIAGIVKQSINGTDHTASIAPDTSDYATRMASAQGTTPSTTAMADNTAIV